MMTIILTHCSGLLKRQTLLSWTTTSPSFPWKMLTGFSATASSGTSVLPGLRWFWSVTCPTTSSPTIFHQVSIISISV